MIIGIGTDIINIARMKKSINKYGLQFLNHIFTTKEQQQAPKTKQNITYYAGRWAAKEAITKALGTGIGKNCAWKDIQINKTDTGKPTVTLFNAAKQTAKKLNITNIQITISHEKNNAIAFAIAEQQN